MKSAVRRKYGPRPAHPFKTLLLSLAVDNGGELSPASFLDWLEQHGNHVRSNEKRLLHRAYVGLDRDFASLAREGLGSLRTVTRQRGYSGKLFRVNDLGRLRRVFLMIEAIFRMSDETDQKRVLAALMTSARGFAADSRSYQRTYLGSIESFPGESVGLLPIGD